MPLNSSSHSMVNLHLPLLQGGIRAVSLGTVGCTMGLLYLLGALLVGPLKALIAVVGIGVATLVMIRPQWGFILMVACIPLDRVGRFTSADSTLAFSAAKILGMITLASWLIHTFMQKMAIKGTRELFPLLAYMIVGACSLWYTTDVLATQSTLLRFVTTWFFLILVVNLVNSSTIIYQTLTAFLLVTMFVGVISIGLRFFPSFTAIGDEPRDTIGVIVDTAEEDHVGAVKSSKGFTVHPGFYVLNLLIALPLYLYWYQKAESLSAKVFWLGGGALAVVNLLLTYRRSGVVVLGVIAVFLVIKRLWRVSPTTPFWGALVFLGVLLVIPTDMRDRLFSLSAFDPEQSHNIQSRIRMWEGALMLIQDHWLLGVGLGNHRELQHYNNLHEIIREAGAHNGYLQLLIETGLVGFVVFLFLLYSLWKNFSMAESQFANSPTNTTLGKLSGFLKAAFLVPILLAMTGIEFTMPLRDWWLICGLGIVLRRFAYLDRQHGQERAYPS